MIFLNSASSAVALVFYLPGVCTHQGKTEKGKSPKYFKIFEKTQYLMNTLYHFVLSTSPSFQNHGIQSNISSPPFSQNSAYPFNKIFIFQNMAFQKPLQPPPPTPSNLGIPYTTFSENASPEIQKLMWPKKKIRCETMLTRYFPPLPLTTYQNLSSL